MKEAVEFINDLQDDLEQRHPFMAHDRHWWARQVRQEGRELVRATVDEPTLLEWQQMRKEFADNLMAILRYGYVIGIQPSDVFDLALMQFGETEMRAESGFYPRGDRI